jgi:hypothetical protein
VRYWPPFESVSTTRTNASTGILYRRFYWSDFLY